MSVNNLKKQEQMSDIDTSVDSFIKELEAKEKDLDISSDMVIEIGDSDVVHENIHESFIPNSTPDNSGSAKPAAPSDAAPNSAKTETDQASQELVSKLTEERDELKETLVRRQRDFENYRNRTARERAETFTTMVVQLAAMTLPVIDNLNRALDAFSDTESKDTGKDFQTFLEGIVLVNQQLAEVLSDMGVQQILAVGKPFDPNYHEAVETEESDEHPPRTVISEILRGYKVDDRIIRASMVKVSSEKSSKEE